MGIGKCRLCLEEKSLCKSHIIPEFLYKPIYEPVKRQLIRYHCDPSIKNVVTQKGIWEYLLCQECETKLSRHERYVANYFKQSLYPKLPASQSIVSIQDHDYKKLKLFLLSIIWKASVSKHEAFHQVALGPYEEEIRKLIINESYIAPDHYPFTMSAAVINNHHSIGLMILPSKGKEENATFYATIFGGFIWKIFITKRFVSKLLAIAKVSEQQIAIAQIDPRIYDWFNDLWDSVKPKMSKLSSQK